MENKTLTYLNSKVWYRLLKVVAIFTLLIATYINTVHAMRYVLKQWYTPCMSTCAEVYKNAYEEALHKNIKLNPNFVTGEVKCEQNCFPKKTWLYVLEYLIISNLLLLFAFNIGKRILYYIILGTSKPKK